jgi:hypothetical protein
LRYIEDSILQPYVELHFLINSLLRSEQAANSGQAKSKNLYSVVFFKSKMNNSVSNASLAPAWLASQKNRETCEMPQQESPKLNFGSILQIVLAGSALGEYTLAPVLLVEYHATMESYSDKFHVDIPNVM